MHQQDLLHKKFPLRAVFGGLMAMFLAFGVGRFAYTPLLPLMRDQAGVAIDQAGYLASMMYLGYLSGSILITRTLARLGAFNILRLGLIILVLASGAMALGQTFSSWALMMFGIGFSSAMIFLATLSLVLGIFLEYGAGWLTAFLYSGIGLAIVLFGLLVPSIGRASGWQNGWWFVAGAATLSGILCYLLLAPFNDRHLNQQVRHKAWPQHGAKRAAVFLIGAYCLHGFAYTIGSTFMISMLSEIPGLQGRAQIGWVLVGAMVIPACCLWPFVAARIGAVKSVTILLSLLALSNLCLLLWQSPLGVLLAAALFGSSFLTVPGLILGQLGLLAGGKRDEVTGLATILFGISMVLGPSTGGYITKLTGSFDISLAMASLALVCAAAISLQAFPVKRNQQRSSQSA